MSTGLRDRSPRLRPTRSKPTLSRAELAVRITQGDLLFIHKSRVINATAWLSFHPGGELAILHFVGRDATDEVEAYHSTPALERMDKFVVATVDVDDELGWAPLTPPIALGLVRHPDGIKGHWAREGQVKLGANVLEQTKEASEVIEIAPAQLEPTLSSLDRKKERDRSKAYHDLREKVTAAGLFERPGPLGGYGSDIVRYTLLGGTAFALYFLSHGWLGQMASAAFMGMFWHQLTFLAHDAGHAGVTGDWWTDKVVGIIVANWIGGLSLGWWCDNHNTHHLVTNHPEHDPDIQHIPFFAISKDFFGSMWSTYYKRVMAFDPFSKAMISLQHKLYYVILSLARVNLFANSYAYLFGPRPKRNGLWVFELTGVAFFWAYYLSMLRGLPTWQMRLAYTLMSFIVASPVHVQIVLSHFACSTEDLGPSESFASRQLRTTMDVVCSPEVEFLHGGLHLQVTHHLFPRMPRHNLRKASLLVKDYCKEQDILYREHGFVEGNRQVLSVLEDVANQISFIKTVADAEIDEKLR